MFFVLILLLAFPASAIDSSSFANNAISDLGPLIALFGDQATTLFLRSSFSTLDYILFAMAPIGILTAINAAIRVGNILWLKLLIGRGGESDENVEIELLSSTSKEVCEIWNSRELVRISGNGNVLEVLYRAKQPPASADTDDINADLANRVFSYDDELVMKMEPVQKSYPKNRGFGLESGYGPDESQGTSGLSRKESTSSMESKPSPAPNISLNFRDPRRCSTAVRSMKRWPMIWLTLAAGFGTILQSGVLAYFWILTYHPTLKDDSDDVFPVVGLSLAFPGTMFLVAGMFLCAYVVERRTNEDQWSVKQDSAKFEMIWIQNRRESATEYSSCIVFADGPHGVVVTSHRTPEIETGTWRKDIIVVFGAGLTILGFLMQLFGLRMMHWTASVAQFGATLIMVLLRTLVRAHLSKCPVAKPIPEGHELDWVASRLERREDKEHSLLRCKSDKRHETCQIWSSGCWNWSIIVELVSADDRRAKKGFLRSGDPGLNLHLSGEGQSVLKMRERLGALSEKLGKTWSGPTNKIAGALAHAIDHFMNSTYRSDSNSKTPKYWTMAVDVGGGVNPSLVTFRLDLETSGKGPRRWKSSPKELEAFLSLWLFQLSRETEQSKMEQPIEVSRNAMRCIGVWSREFQNDMLLWGGTEAELNLYVAKELGVTEGRAGPGSDDREQRWDLETVSAKTTFGIPKLPDAINDPSEHRAFQTRNLRSFKPGNETDLYVTLSFDTDTATLCAHELFCQFLETAVSDGEFERTRIKGDTTLRDGPTPDAWREVQLKNSHMADLAQKVRETGLMSFDHAYLYIIAALSKTQKLPQSEDLLKFTRAKAVGFNKQARFDDTVGIHEWFIPICKQWSAEMEKIAYGWAIGFQFQIDWAIMVMEQEAAPHDDIQRVRGARDELLKLFPPNHVELVSFYPPHSAPNPSLVAFKSLEIPASGHYDLELSRFLAWTEKLSDDFRRTALHYFATGGNFPIRYWASDQAKPDTAEAQTVNVDVGVIEQEAYRVLLDKGRDIDPNNTDMFGRTPLHEAASKGLDKVVDYLISRGASVDLKDDQGITALHCAAREGHLAIAIRLITGAGASVTVRDNSQKSALHWLCHGLLHTTDFSDDDTRAINVLFRPAMQLRDRHGRTALHLAAALGCSRNFTRLMANGVLRKAEGDGEGMNPLHLAAKMGHLAPVEQLLTYLDSTRNSIYSSDHSNSGAMPIHLAAAGGHKDVVKMLLEKTTINALNEFTQDTPLHVAAREQPTIVELLLNHNSVNVNAKNVAGKTALHIAASSGAEKSVKMLLDYGVADIDEKCKTADDMTALHLSVIQGHTAIVNLLRERGADIRINARNENTVIHLAAQSGRAEMVMLLVSEENVKMVNTEGSTALHIAADRDHIEVAKQLLVAGADIDAEDVDGWTPLIRAVDQSHVNMVKLLLEKESKVDTRVNDSGESGLTALHVAALRGNKVVVELLLKDKAGINDQTAGGFTPLMFASRDGHVDVISVLLANDANVEKSTYKGLFTALHLAVRNRKRSDVEVRKMVQMLLDKGADPTARNVLKKTAKDMAIPARFVETVEALERGEAVWTRKPPSTGQLSGS